MSEEFYDEVIAPELLRLAKLCEENGLSIVAAVQYSDEGDVGTTVALSKDATWPMRVLYILAQCCSSEGVLIDDFMFPIMRHAREYGHSSIVLSQLGIPTSPKQGEGDDAKND